jgi:hypothetical protein
MQLLEVKEIIKRVGEPYHLQGGDEDHKLTYKQDIFTSFPRSRQGKRLEINFYFNLTLQSR